MKVGSNVSPLLGGKVPELGVEVQAEQAKSAGKLSLQQPTLGKDLAQYLDLVDQLRSDPNKPKAGPFASGGAVAGFLDNFGRSIGKLLAAPNGRDPAGQQAISPRSAAMQAELGDVGKQLLQIYADGRVTESELGSLRELSGRVGRLREVWDEGALKMLPKDVRGRLENDLFGPLMQLGQAMQTQHAAVFSAVADRDAPALDALVKRFNEKGPPYFALNVPPDQLTSRSRYTEGSMIMVPRSGGGTSFGVVQRSEKDGLMVAVEDARGFALRKVSDAEIAQANPFKLGDVFDFQNAQIYVMRGADGRMGGAYYDGAGKSVYLSLEQLQSIAKTMASEVAAVPTHPKQKIITQGSVIGGAEALETTGFVHRLQAKSATGAMSSTRGPNEAQHGVKYADYNEDAAIIGAAKGKDGKEIVVGAACDQAGGMGKVPGQTGRASAIAAQEIDRALQIIAETGADPSKALTDAAVRAHEALVKLNVDNGMAGNPAVTTFTATAIKDGYLHVVGVGDSKVWHFGKDGKLKNQLDPDNMGDKLAKQSGDPNNAMALKVSNMLTSCLGAPDTSAADVASQVLLQKWKLEPGDRVVIASDALCDANLQAQKKDVAQGKKWPRFHSEVTTDQIAQIVAGSKDATEATERLRNFALQKMAAGEGKPDNTTVVVLQAS